MLVSPPGPSIGCSRKWSKARPSNVAGSTSCCGNTSFNSLPVVWINGVVPFGLTVIQSRPGGTRSVPLVSTAISNRRSWSADSSAASTCNSGSPPVSTTKSLRRAAAPHPLDGNPKGTRVVEAAAAFPIHADEVRVAEIARRRRAIHLSSAPQIAAGEAAEHRRPAGVTAFALQRVKHFLDRIRHRLRSDRDAPATRCLSALCGDGRRMPASRPADLCWSALLRRISALRRATRSSWINRRLCANASRESRLRPARRRLPEPRSFIDRRAADHQPCDGGAVRWLIAAASSAGAGCRGAGQIALRASPRGGPAANCVQRAPGMRTPQALFSRASLAIIRYARQLRRQQKWREPRLTRTQLFLLFLALLARRLPQRRRSAMNIIRSTIRAGSARSSAG